METTVLRLTRSLSMFTLLAFVIVCTSVANIEWTENRPFPSPTREAMSKCQPVPEGQFPTHAVVERKSGNVEYTDKKWLVDYLFDVAVGEVPALSGVSEFTLCR